VQNLFLVIVPILSLNIGLLHGGEMLEIGIKMQVLLDLKLVR
jgi:hypothetical protein